MKFIKKIDDYIKESLIQLENNPELMYFWHGGNLDDFNDVISHKNGRYEWGAGLYLITHYDTAKKYSKGSRKLYIIGIEKGVEISESLLDIDLCLEFIKKYIISTKRNLVLSRLEKYIIDSKISTDIFNNVILNTKAIKASNTKYLRELFIKNNIDYELVYNPFGWHETMMVLYNMKKIKEVIQFKSTDRMDDYDLSKYLK